MAAKLGSFDDLMVDVAPAVKAIARRLRKIIQQVDPAAVEVVRLGDGAATFGVGPRKMIDGYAYIMAQERWVNLGFYRGATLPDPAGLLEGTGAKMRHVKVRSLADAAKPALKKLLAAALTERKRAG